MDSGDEPLAPPTVAACATPSVALGATWMAASDQRFSSLRLARVGADVALAYAESTDSTGSTGPGRWDIKVQRLTAAGEILNAVIDVGGSVGATEPSVSIASSGDRLVVCYSGFGTEDVFACVPITSGGVVSPVLSEAGVSPAVAFREGIWGLVYFFEGDLLSRRLDPAQNTLGAVHGVLFGSLTATPMNPKLVATASGYAMFETAGLGILKRFDAGFDEIERSVVLAWPDSTFDVAASGDTVATVWLRQGVPMLRQVEDSGESSEPVEVAPLNPGSRRPELAVAGGDESFAVVWSGLDGASIGYRAFDIAGLPRGEALPVIALDPDDSPVAVAPVGDGFLAAVAGDRPLDRMLIIHLGCP